MSEKSIGALWAKVGKHGEYFTGNIELNGEKIGIVAFFNSNKKNPKEPDYRILKSVPKNSRPSDSIHTKEEQEEIDGMDGIPVEDDVNPEDIPF